MDASDAKTEIPTDKFLTIPCGECNRPTRHKKLAVTSVSWEENGGIVSGVNTHQIVQCQGCSNISFYCADTCSEDWEPDENGNSYYVPTEKFYPNRLIGRPLMREIETLPWAVASIYKEAHGALCAGLPILAGLGVRAIVEAVCQERGIIKGDLKLKIDDLATQGFITKEGATILHRLRFMGNAAAHEMKAHAIKELNAGFEVAEYLMHGVYVLPKYAALLPAQKPKPSKQKVK